MSSGNRSYVPFREADAEDLRSATTMLVSKLAHAGNVRPEDHGLAAWAVLWVAKAGYARRPEHSIAMEDLAEAALARYRAIGMAPTTGGQPNPSCA